MFVDFSNLIDKGDTIAVAVSGGSDSMALLHYMSSKSKELQINVIAINIEHGIRGEASVKDSAFVKDYCEKAKIKFYGYSLDCLDYSHNHKLGIEESARTLRYQCFFDAIETGLCNKVATAHHAGDNAESVLFNLLRGSGISGITGIKSIFKEKIIRPLLLVTKEEINDYVTKNNIPFVTDETNLLDDYTRNFLRLNVIPQIKKVFPEAEKSISRFTEVAQIENDYLNSVAESVITKETDGSYSISLPCHKAVFNRATIKILKSLGMEKDWEKVHVDSVFSLMDSENSSETTLPKGICAIREYDKVVFYKKPKQVCENIDFVVKDLIFENQKISIKKVDSPDLKSGLFADLDKIPKNAIIRTRKNGDTFTKFGGGTKLLNDFFTDKKIPLRKRDFVPLLTYESSVLAIFGIAISDKIKVDNDTKNIIKFTIEGIYNE